MKQYMFRTLSATLSLILCAISMHSVIYAEEPADIETEIIEEVRAEDELKEKTPDTDILEEPEEEESGSEPDQEEEMKPELIAANLALNPTIEYVDECGNTRYVSEYQNLSYVLRNGCAGLYDGWYVADKSAGHCGRLCIHGDVHIILPDGVTIEFYEGISNPEGSSLSIYGQKNNSGTLVVDHTTKRKDRCAGIGGNEGENGGVFNMFGGTVKARGGQYAAGIGGGEKGNGGIINIYDGFLEAKGGSSAGAGIGGGNGGDGGTINIYGGTVNAYGGTDWTEAGAGIGGGNHGNGGTIHIWYGTVHAEGAGWASGIGGGNCGNGGHIVIDGGDIYALGKSGGAGIGGGDDGDSGIIEILGGNTEAHGNFAVGCGEDGANRDITLGDHIGLLGLNFSDRYTALAIAQDAWIGKMEDDPCEEISYLDQNGEVHWLSDYVNLSRRPNRGNDILESGWYVVREDWTFECRPSVCGEVNIILCDGVTLNMIHGIRNYAGQTLNIYAQSDGENMGRLIAGSYDNQAGIGGNDNESNGTINIYGGHIEATGTHQGAGIGGGDSGSGGEINIYGGDVHAWAHTDWSKVTNGVGAGIGGGDNGNTGTIRIFGGRVCASSEHVRLWPFYDNWGAGIGGGDSGNGGTIEIHGGSVESHGYHAFGTGKDCDGSADIFLEEGMMVAGFDYSDRYNVISYGQDVWIDHQ